jgi:hypothetical protein
VSPAIAQRPGVDHGPAHGHTVVAALKTKGLARGGYGKVSAFIVVVAGVGVDRPAHKVLGVVAADRKGTVVGREGLVEK